MLTITRRQARRLRGVFRRSVLGISHRGALPPLVLRAEGTQLRAQYQHPPVAIEHIELGAYHPHEAIALPLEALAELEGRTETPITLTAVGPDRTVARWEDRGIPQSREFVVPAMDPGAFLEAPGSWTELPAGLLDALAEATATCADESTRYALNCIQLQGTTHEISATDGRQVLVASGFAFPWTADVLIRRSPIFASKDLPRDQPIMVGKTDTHVAFRIGPWTLFFAIQTDVRFPRIDQSIPDTQATVTRLRLDAGDAAYLGQALDRLPGADGLHSPATVDCNGRIAVRARAADQTEVTELVLSRSRYSGTPVRFNTNRAFLARAVGLGFGEIEIVDADTPIVCRDRNRVYCWQPLSHEAALEPTDDATRIESISFVSEPASPQAEPPKARTTVSERPKVTKDHVPTNGVTNGHIVSENTEPPSLAALIQEAESINETLSELKTRSGRLIVALRRYRRRERLVANTLASLRQLKLSEVAE